MQIIVGNVRVSAVCTRQYTYYKSLFKIGDTQCYIEFLFAPLKIIFSIRPCKSGQIKRSWTSFTFFTISIRFLIPAMAFYAWIRAVAGNVSKEIQCLIVIFLFFIR